MEKYITSKIDNETYCVQNGAFSRHLKKYKLDRQLYYEKYITGKKEYCPICNASKKFYQKNNTYANTCGAKTCASQYAQTKITTEQKDITSQQRKEMWDNRSEEQIKQMSIKRKNTVKERYGVDHPMHLPEVKDKIKETNLERYGHEVGLCSDKVKEKIKATVQERYGVDHPMHLPEVKDKVRSTYYNNHAKYKYFKNKETLADMYNEHGSKETANYFNVSVSNVHVNLAKLNIPKRSTIVSSFESEILNYIKSQYKGDIITSDKTVLGNKKELDIYIPSANIAFECNGSYWHAENQGRGKKYHLEKTKLCEQKGINLIHVWHHDWLFDTEKVKSHIKSLLQCNERIYARKCVIKEIESKQCKEFLNNNHRQNACQSKINLGLYYNNNLVALMTFGKSRYNKKYEYELLRFCSSQGINVVGGASKLFKHFVRIYNPSSVISYADKQMNSGNLYNKLGFVYYHSSPPAYHYTKDYMTFENRVKYQKHKLKDKLQTFNPYLTEWENMKANGYDRIWDCGANVYGWKPK